MQPAGWQLAAVEAGEEVEEQQEQRQKEPGWPAGEVAVQELTAKKTAYVSLRTLLPTAY